MAKPTKALNYTNHIVYWTITGLEYGYPPCCIGEFIIHNVKDSYKQRRNEGPRKFHGTGYVPCVKCNERTEEELLNYITEHRTFYKPFPTDKEDELESA